MTPELPDITGDVVFQQNLAREHQYLITTCASPIVNEAFMQGLDGALEGILDQCSGSEYPYTETWGIVNAAAEKYLSQFEGLSPEHVDALKRYARGYIWNRLGSRSEN